MEKHPAPSRCWGVRLEGLPGIALDDLDAYIFSGPRFPVWPYSLGCFARIGRSGAAFLPLQLLDRLDHPRGVD